MNAQKIIHLQICFRCAFEKDDHALSFSTVLQV